MTQPAMLRTDDGLVLFLNGETYDLSSSHPNFDRIIEAVNDERYDEIPSLANVATSVTERSQGRVVVKDNVVYYNNEPLHNTLTERMINMLSEGFDIDPMINFLDNLMDNPSHRAVTELYDFLETGKMPITPDGCFLAYKNVRNDFTDIFSGKFDNSVGSKPEMNRNEVDDDKDRTCSKGLHFCSLDYLNFYGNGPANKTVIVKVNPRDVVSIPSDHQNKKGRACKYEVVGVHEGRGSKEAFDKTVHDYGGTDQRNKRYMNASESKSRGNHSSNKRETNEQRVFYVDVDQMPPHTADSYFDQTKNEIASKSKSREDHSSDGKGSHVYRETFSGTVSILNDIEMFRKFLEDEGFELRYISSSGRLNKYPRIEIIKESEYDKFIDLIRNGKLTLDAFPNELKPFAKSIPNGSMVVLTDTAKVNLNNIIFDLDLEY